MGVLRDRPFRRLLAGQIVSSFAASALYLALGIWAKDLTHSNALAGCVFLALGVPSLLGPLAGHLVDRLPRRTLLITTNGAVGVAELALLAVHGRGQLWVIYAVAAVIGAANTVLGASRSALLRDMLADADLGPANAVLQTTSQGLRLLSPLAGAGLYTAIGGHGVTLVNSALFGLAALLLAMVRVTESAPGARAARLRDDLLAGFRHVRSVPLLVQLTVVGAFAFAVVGLFETVGFAVVDQGLHRSPSFYGVVDSVQGAGAVVGGLTAAWVLRRLGEARSVGVGLAAVGIGAVGLVSSSMALVMIGTVVIGAGVPWFVVGWSTGLQRYTPPRLQGRVNATATMLLNGPQTASIGLGATLIAVVDYRILLMVICVGMLTCGVVLLLRPASAAPAQQQVSAVPAAPVG
ncbi:MAG TPA: MFS transporter [Pseudonocardiaceae bacterium]|jgi:MFS family permease|nr:MFS transporter [Pseudonocardiaceae bacterium]